MAPARYSRVRSLASHLHDFADPNFAAYLIKRTQKGWDKPEYYAQEALRLAREAGTACPAPVKSDRFEVGAIEINNFCNLNCRMCNSSQASRPPGLMPPDVFECLVKQLKAAGIERTALHTIGEPLLHGSLPRLLEIAEKHKLKVWLSTNAQFPDLLETILKDHRQALSSIRISVDGATDGTYEYLRTGGHLDKVLQSLEVIGRLNGGQPDCDFNLNLHTVVSMSNIHEIPLFFKIFAKYVWPERMIFSLINGLSPDPAFFRETFPFPNLITPATPCLHPFRHMSILNDGRASLCCADFDGELTIGNALDTPLSTLWHSPAAEAIRRQHLETESMQLQSCKRCHEPYSFSSHILDAYIHFLWLSSPELSAGEFGEMAIGLLKAMDQAVAQNELRLLPDRIQLFFGNE